VPGDELPAQRQEKIDEERERANAALLLDEAVEERVMDIVLNNEETFARYIGYIFARHLSRHPDFEGAVMRIVKQHAAKKE
jgi:hypothetical protein